MLILYIYLSILLLMLVFIYWGITSAARFAPIKIKILSIIVLVMVIFRLITLLIMFFSQNIIFLYLLKPFAFLNLLYIPIIVMICLYIFIRNDKINFNYLFILCGIFTVIYSFIICFEPAVIQGLSSYGYSMTFVGNLYILFAFIVIITIALIFCVITLGKPIVNNLGVFLVLVSSAVCIADILLSMIGYEYLTENILGELLFILTMNFALSTFKS